MTRLARSFLFVPGDRPDRFDKAAASGAHQVIIDLEDAVGLADKVSARQSVHDWLAAGHAAGVRINGADTEWFEDDLKMLRNVSPAAVMLPKADAEAARVTGTARVFGDRVGRDGEGLHGAADARSRYGREAYRLWQCGLWHGNRHRGSR